MCISAKNCQGIAEVKILEFQGLIIWHKIMSIKSLHQPSLQVQGYKIEAVKKQMKALVKKSKDDIGHLSLDSSDSDCSDGEMELTREKLVRKIKHLEGQLVLKKKLDDYHEGMCA